MDNTEIDFAKETARFEAMYKHYKIVYRKLTLLFCPNERKVANYNRDYYKEKNKETMGSETLQ